MSRVVDLNAERYRRRPIDVENGRIELTHGAGGRAMVDLIDGVFRAAFSNPLLDKGNDQAVFEMQSGRLVMSTDTFVVSPLFFPGGDIGSLAVHGTINDVAIAGAVPRYLSTGFVLEEGFPLSDLTRIVRSMAEAARNAGVLIITGDTKVVERGKCDGIYINTAGIGQLVPGLEISSDRARPGDKVVISGTIGEHGVAILASRNGFAGESGVRSDTAAVNGLVAQMIHAVPGIHVLRDPTRGGLGAVLNEIAHRSIVGIHLDRRAIPVRPEVSEACRLMGLDPLNCANEGKVVAVAPAAEADRLVAAMREHPLGREAAIIGEVIADRDGYVAVRSDDGHYHLVDWLVGSVLPRVC